MRGQQHPSYARAKHGIGPNSQYFSVPTVQSEAKRSEAKRSEAKRSEAKRVRKCEGMRRNSKGNTKEFEREYEEGKVDPKQKKTEQSRTKQSTQA